MNGGGIGSRIGVLGAAKAAQTETSPNPASEEGKRGPRPGPLQVSPDLAYPLMSARCPRCTAEQARSGDAKADGFYGRSPFAAGGRSSPGRSAGPAPWLPGVIPPISHACAVGGPRPSVFRPSAAWQNWKGDQQGTRSYPRRRSAVSIAISTRDVMPGSSTGRRPATWPRIHFGWLSSWCSRAYRSHHGSRVTPAIDS